MKRILVGVDGSAEAKAAAEFAAGQLQPGGQLVLAYFVHPPVVEEPMAMGPAAQQLRDYGKGLLRELAARCVRPGVAVETALRDGAPAAGLADLAAEIDADLVVVGHRGLGAVQRFFIGSVAERLIRLSAKPVLVYR